MQHNTSNNNTNIENYLPLSHFDNELQQQAQFGIQQDIQSWENFSHYLPSVNYNRPVTQVASPDSCQSIPSPTGNVNIKVDFTSPDKLPCFTHSPPFDSPESIIQQQNSPLFNDQPFFNNPSKNSTPLETPLDSPKDDLLGSIALQYNDTAENHLQPSSITTRDDSPPPQQKKSAHNAIERRYRNNINDRIAELKNAVPALVYAKVKDNTNRSHKRSYQDDDEDDDGQEYLDGVAVATKLNKATILRKATEYIIHLKRQEEEMKQENNTLQHLLSQLPGGYEILNRYQSQKLQREQEIQRQRMHERALQKQQQQKQRKSSRKRSCHASPDSIISSNSDNTNNQFFMPIIHHPQQQQKQQQQQQQPIANRVFMTVFMAITFISASPVTTNNYVHHTSTAQASKGSFLSWWLISTVIFAFVLFQILGPVIPYCFTYARARRIPKKPKNNIKVKHGTDNTSFHEAVNKRYSQSVAYIYSEPKCCAKCAQQFNQLIGDFKFCFKWLRNLIASIRNNR